jgi:hypothetical protein
MIVTILIGLFGVIIFNLLQKKYKPNINISEIKKHLLPLDLCIKKRQCLDFIKLNKFKFKLKYVPLKDEEYINKYRLSNHILSNLYDDSRFTINMKTKNSETTKHFTFLNDDIVIFYDYIIGRYLLREVDKELLNVPDSFQIYYCDDSDYSRLTCFKFNYLTKDTKKIYGHEFNIDNFEFVNNTIVLDVSNDSDNILE